MTARSSAQSGTQVIGGEVDADRGRQRILGRPTMGGVAFALLFWCMSLTPTLIPRSFVFQALVGAVSLAIGYGVGGLVERLVHWLRDRAGYRRDASFRRLGWIALGAGWLIAIVAGAALWIGWQDDLVTMMGMPPVGWVDAVVAVGLSIVGGVVLVLVGRAIVNGVRALNSVVRRILGGAPIPGAVAPALTAVVILVGLALVWRGAIFAADLVYRSANDGTTPGTVQPTSAAVSGSSASLAPWDTLGLQGRDFVAGATTEAELRAFHGPDVPLTEPVRAYVGVRTMDSMTERAALAVRELERAGGLDRAVLAVWIPTGTGWVVAEAADALEQLYAGDTAIVAMQYGYLPSLFSVLMQPGLAAEAGLQLYEAVHERWSQLPADNRPRLVVYGKSLGSSGIEAPFADADAASSVANLVAGSEGALLVGAPYGNPIHSQVTHKRDPGSPVWQPIVDGGRTVRFLNRDPNQPALNPDWSVPRIVYLQHPSDPACFWGLSAFWWPPEWMDQPRGFDVPDAAVWFPIVSGVQGAVDLVLQLSPPPGFGHDYGLDYVEGWASTLAPEGWDDADSRRLEEFLDAASQNDLE